MSDINKNKTILDLCGGTGSWSKPYKDNGYNVINVTLPEYDVLKYFPPDKVYGILAAPPCTMFSFARTNAKIPRNLKKSMDIVLGCLKIIWECQYKIKKDTQKYSPLKFWALENPNGFLKFFLGDPCYTFDPWEFGDCYKKRTHLWGYFNKPVKVYNNVNDIMSIEELNLSKTNSRKLPKFDSLKTKQIHNEFYGVFDRQTRRSITPQGFAEAFFEVNK